MRHALVPLVACLSLLVSHAHAQDAPPAPPPPACPPESYCEELPVDDVPLDPEVDEPLPPEDLPIEEYEPVTEPEPALSGSNLGSKLVIAGGVLFALGYLPAVAVGCVATGCDEDEDDVLEEDEEGDARWGFLFVPIIGPVILAEVDEATPGGWVAAGASTAAQATGVALLVVGLLVDDDEPPTAVQLRPGATGAGPLLTLDGRF